MTENEKILAGLLKEVQSWEDLKPKLSEYNTSLSDTTNKTTLAGKLFEYFAKYYFIVDATQNQLYSDVWLYDEVDLLTKEELGLPAKDKGVDLLLKDRQGRYYVVQCKFKNNEESIVSFGKDKIANTFFWAKKCFGVILFTNVSDCTDDIKNEKNFNAIKSDSLLALDSYFFSSVLSLIELNVPTPSKKHEPREDQKIAINKVLQHFKTNDRGQLILPCGAGKTTTSLWIKEQLGSTSTLVLFPSLALLRQFKTEWAEQRSVDYVYRNVCSEKDIDKSKDDSTVTHIYEISGITINSTDKIREFLVSDSENKIVFCTYQSIKLIQETLAELPNFSFDLIVCDEAHRTAGGAKQNTFAIVHDQTKIRGKKRLYMTATPRVVSVQLKAKLGHDYALLCDMSNPDIYGAEAFRMSFAEAIEQKILVDYKIIGIGVTQKQVKQFIDQRRYVTEEYDLKDIADNYALSLVMDKYSAFHAITFHSQVTKAREFSERHNNYFGENVYANHVSGKDKTSKRAAILKRFKNNVKGVVSNARCLTEGVDVPVIDLIYFCDPKNSKIDIVQASGRALRKDRHGQKPIGYIVVPIFHHIDEDIEKEIEKKPYFQNLIQVIRSLCDQDERLQAEIDEVAFNKGERISKRLVVDYGDSEIEKIITFEGIEKEVKKYLFDQIIEKTRDNWNVMFSNLVEFKKIYGTTNVTRKHQGFETLRWWIQAQRDNYFKKKLSPFQIEKLNEIGFEWKGEQRREITDRFEIWMQSYRKLEQYFLEYGNSNVPARYENDKSLGSWVVEQRVKYDEGKLTDQQIELLEKLKIDWDPKNTYPEFIKALRAYKDLYGDVNVSQSDYENRKLAAKCSRIRSIYRYGKETKNGDYIFAKKGRLTKWAIQQLIDLGFEWDVANPEWDERFSDLKEFFEKNGHSNVKAADNQSLAYWCYRQRRDKESLTDEQLAKFKTVNFEFSNKANDSEKNFLNRLEQLQKYYNQKGTFFISEKDNENKPLKSWLGKIRTKYNKGELPEDWILLLENIGYSFNATAYEDYYWNEKFSDLKEFYEANKTFVLFDKKGMEYLNRWLLTQRKEHRNGTLKPEREKKLVDLGYSFAKKYSYVTDETKTKISENYWNKNVSEFGKYLIEFKTIQGIEKKPEYAFLYRWIKNIKRLDKSNSLSEQKRIELVQVGFDFNYKPIRTKKEKLDNWAEMLEEFKKWHQQTGTFYIPLKGETNKQLAYWLKSQKTVYRKGLLDIERIKQIESTGFSFKENYKPRKKVTRWQKNRIVWDEKFALFKNYFETNNTYYIPIPDKQNKELRIWLQSQIAKYRREKLSKQEIEKFQSIGFTFLPSQITRPKTVRIHEEKEDKVSFWDKQYLALVAYKIENGNCNVPRNYSNQSLANWVSSQRTKYNKKQLTEEQIIKLNFLGFTWDKVKSESEKQVWLKTYTKLKAFYESYGHSSPTIEYGDKQLLKWIMQQRHRGKIGILKQEYVQLLNALNFNWTPDPSGGSIKPNDSLWLQNFEKLKDYKNKFGSTNVSQINKDYKALGKWVNDQRHQFKKGKLSDFRINKLNEISFIWNAGKNNQHTIDTEARTANKSIANSGA